MSILRPVQTTARPTSRRRVLRSAVLLLVLALPVLAGLLWWAAPALLAPVEPFQQGPGGAIAYVSVTKQIRDQSYEFWTGGDVQIRLSEGEVSGMLSSALLTGRQPGDPIEKVRGHIVDGTLRVETVVTLPYEQVPQRLRGPLGISVRLSPVVTETGVVQFQIIRARVGRVPIPASLIRLAGRVYPMDRPGFSAQEATINLPISDLVSEALGRRLEIKEFTADHGELILTIAMPEMM